jgi:hypothetical protein
MCDITEKVNLSSTTQVSLCKTYNLTNKTCNTRRKFKGRHIICYTVQAFVLLNSLSFARIPFCSYILSNDTSRHLPRTTRPIVNRKPSYLYTTLHISTTK